MNEFDEQSEILEVIKSLFNNCDFIAEVYISIPNAYYQGVVETLGKYEDLFRHRNIAWQLKHADLGFELRFDRTNRKLEKKVI